MSRWFLLALASVPLFLSSFRPRETELMWWTTHGLEKIRPFDRIPEAPAREVRISAARNEFEPFQIVLRGGNEDSAAIDVDVSDLHGPDDAVLAKSNITVYLERYQDLKVPSAIDGGAGEWPDALVPRVDRYAHERRNAFPFTLQRNRNQPVWVDVYVPRSATAGSYRGNVQVQIGGKPAFKIPVVLEVWNFELPSTSTLVNTFAFSGGPAVRQHYGRYTGDEDVAKLTTLYRKSALWHRISLDGGSALPPALSVAGDDVRVNWNKYDAQVGAFMDGTAFTPDEPLPGARLTSIVLRTPPALENSKQQMEFWQQAAAHFKEKGWFDRLVNYLWDEPAKAQYPAMVARGEMVRRAVPEIRNLVTAPYHAEWAGFVDIWTPVINCFERKPGHTYCERVVPRPDYADELSKGKELWSYQSCASHGCNIVGGEYFRGWPSYMIDAAPVRNRIMQWMSWKYDVHGELYFNTNEAYFRKKDPWKDVSLFGGNGDGTLFYPGRPDVIGGASHIPVESIRLKLIREGLEDYEYLKLFEKLRGHAAAAGIVDSFIRTAYDYDQDPLKLYLARDKMGRELQGDSKLKP